MLLKDRHKFGVLDWITGGETGFVAGRTRDGKRVAVELWYPSAFNFVGSLATETEWYVFKTWGKANEFLREINAVEEGEPTPNIDYYWETYRNRSEEERAKEDAVWQEFYDGYY